MWSPVVAVLGYSFMRRIPHYHLPIYVDFDWSPYSSRTDSCFISSDDRVQGAGSSGAHLWVTSRKPFDVTASV